jgi:hypothetical protein
MNVTILNMAIQEAQHVFIKTDFPFWKQNNFQFGNKFGTGLNAFITFGRKMKQSIEYVGVEAYPISAEDHVDELCWGT